MQQRDVVAFHELEAALETGLDPASDIAEPVPVNVSVVPSNVRSGRVFTTAVTAKGKLA